MSTIAIDHVHKRFGAITVLQGIDLRIEQGSVLALLGPSGCGKTTLLRLIAGFDPVDEGQIRFGDRVMASRRHFVPPERRRIGYVPQEGALFPHLTVAGNLRYGLPRSRGREATRRVDEVLELIGLAGYGERYPHELSGGQQQRVALGRALAPRPTLVLLDEPFNALDLDLRRSMCEDVIDLLRQTGTTTVLVTHDPGEAFAVSDQLAVMLEGRIMQCAPPETVYWQPSSEEVARLTGEAIVLPATTAEQGVHCLLGDRPLPRGLALPPDEEVAAMVRPEQVQWQDEPGHGIPARVIRRSFRGAHTQVVVAVAGLTLQLQLPSLQAPALHAQGRISLQGPCMVWAQAASRSARITPLPSAREPAAACPPHTATASGQYP